MSIGLFACKISIVWNFFEGGAGVYFGLKAGQLSLTTFGAQSLIEILSASLVLFRFNLDASDVSTVYDRERYGSRAIGYCLVFLAMFAAAGSAIDLKRHNAPDTSAYGIIVAGVSATAMAVLWAVKLKAGTVLNSSVMLSDAKVYYKYSECSS